MSILFSQLFVKNNEIRPLEHDFTEVLSSIAVVPKMLYFYGKMPEKRLDLVDEVKKKDVQKRSKMEHSRRSKRPKTVAIVGTRKPTKYGEEIAYKLAYEAAKHGAVVVSGLAFGIDSVAHRGALDAGGTTVAVLGTPVDYIYPRQHEGLAREIIEKGGCVMSELNRGESFHFKGCFLQRNRIIAGLADVVVIPEAAERSGSLNTAAHALEQGREVFAVPGDITRPLSKGCNRLILQGATPYLGPEDVLELLFPTPRKSRAHAVELPLGDNNTETVILRILAQGVNEGGEILALSNLDVAELNRNLTMLELKGRIRSLGANRWALR